MGDKPDCLEVDWLESNGGCGGATTLHTVSGTGPGACNYWGCRSTYSFGSSTFHVKVEYGNDGKLTITRDGQVMTGELSSRITRARVESSIRVSGRFLGAGRFLWR